MANGRQTRRPPSSTFNAGAGKGVDFRGAPVIDPTENVLALHDAEARHRDALRAADHKYFEMMHKAEARRTDDLAKQRAEYSTRAAAQKEAADSRIAEMLRMQTQNNSDLVAKQLDRLITTYDTRIAAVERTQYESGGKAAVMDPTLSEAIKTITALKTVQTAEKGRDEGHSQVIAWAIAAISAAAALFAIFSQFSTPPPLSP